MANTLGIKPALPTLPNNLPCWAYNLLALACIGMGLWASGVTLQYFEHGAKALETDPAMQALAVSAALMFVASEMGAFSLAALLTEAQLMARRWMLTAFAVFVLALEVVTIVAVQLALIVGAAMTQTSVTDNEADLQRQIAAVELNAKTYASTAESLRAADQLKKATAEQAKAQAQTDKAAELYDKLEKVRTQKRPTMTGLLGRNWAIGYAVARGILVSLGGMVFFGTAGALLRVSRGASSAKAGAPSPATDAPAPAASTPDAGAPVDALTVRRKSELGRLLMPKTPKPGASDLTQQEPTGASKLTHSTPEGASKLTQQKATKRTRKSTVVAAGAKCDTGTGPHDGARYQRVKAAVLARTLEPGLRPIQSAEGGGAPTVRGYLAKMCEENVIRPKADGSGYELVNGGAA